MNEPACPCVMIVDDARLVRLYYRETIERGGFAVIEAANGVEALEMLLQQKPDLLIVDINMPQMDGLTFLRTLRRQALPVGGIPALVTSTEATLDDAAAARAAGANFYLVKPIAPDTLLAHVVLLCGQPA